MLFCDINPFIRHANYVNYRSNGNWVWVKDCRLFYVMSGKADFFIDDEHYSLVPNSLLYCRGGSKYNIESSEVILFTINFDLTQTDNAHTTVYPRVSAKDTSTSPFDSSCFVEDCEYINSHLFIKNGTEYLQYIKTILDEYATRMAFFQERGSCILKSILALMHRRNLAPTNHAAIAVSKIISYMRTHYNEPLSNKALSEITGYHEYYLNSLFLKQTNISMHQYIISVRIDEAKKLLLNTNLSIAIIAEKVGFNSNTHFSNYFKQITGYSPLEFRREFRNQT